MKLSRRAIIMAAALNHNHHHDDKQAKRRTLSGAESLERLAIAESQSQR